MIDESNELSRALNVCDWKLESPSGGIERVIDQVRETQRRRLFARTAGSTFAVASLVLTGGFAYSQWHTTGSERNTVAAPSQGDEVPARIVAFFAAQRIRIAAPSRVAAISKDAAILKSVGRNTERASHASAWLVDVTNNDSGREIPIGGGRTRLQRDVVHRTAWLVRVPGAGVPSLGLVTDPHPPAVKPGALYVFVDAVTGGPLFAVS